MIRFLTIMVTLVALSLLSSCASSGTRRPVPLSPIQTQAVPVYEKLEVRWENLPPEEKDLRTSCRTFFELLDVEMNMTKVVREIIRPYKELLTDVPLEYWREHAREAIDQSVIQDRLIDVGLEEFNLAEIRELNGYFMTPTGKKYLNRAAAINEQVTQIVGQWEYDVDERMEIELRRQKYLSDMSRIRINDGNLRERPDPPPIRLPGVSTEEEQRLRLLARNVLIAKGLDLTMRTQITNVIKDGKEKTERVPEAWWGVYASTHINTGTVQERLVDLMLKEFTGEELADLNNFFQTPSGVKYRDRVPVMAQNHLIQTGLWARETKTDLAQKLRREGHLK